MDTLHLTELGFTEKSAQIYLAALGLGTTTISDIAKKSGLKRPTVYIHIEELLKNGLLETIQIKKRLYYRATDPSFLERRAERQLEKIQTILPEITALYTKTINKPKISVLEGRVGVEQVYREIIDQAWNLCLWSNTAQVENYFHPLSRDLAHAVREKNVRAREIVADTKAARRASNIYGRICGKTYTARVATADGIGNDNIIYNNVVAIFRLYEYNFYVVRIEDATVADSMRALFEMAWKAAKPFKT